MAKMATTVPMTLCRIRHERKFTPTKLGLREWSAHFGYTGWAPLRACPAVQGAWSDKPTVAPENSGWTDHQVAAFPD